MALLRCSDHRPDEDMWVAAVEPVGYPETAAVCSARSHADPVSALVFLNADEYYFYEKGQRLFSPPGSAARIHVTDNIVVESTQEVESDRPESPE